MPDHQLTLGGNGQNGEIHVKDAAAREPITLNAGDGSITLRNPTGWTIGLNGNTADLYIGGNGQAGDINVRNKAGNLTIALDGEAGRAQVGGGTKDGQLAVMDGATHERITLLGADGSIKLRDPGSSPTIGLNGSNGDIIVGANGQAGRIDVRNGANARLITLDGETGDIQLANADCAEEFALAADQMAEPGTVMVLDDDGKVCQCSCSYDTRVVGVVSGAGGFKPGIVFDRRQGEHDRRAIALMGKVYCLVTAEAAPIRVGDLLTTSDVPGHAMKVLDPSRAFGALIGKAMAPLASGRGLIPILIALQ